MEVEWDWRNKREIMLEIKKLVLKKEGKNYELWRIWWTICTTRIKRKIK